MSRSHFSVIVNVLILLVFVSCAGNKKRENGSINDSKLLEESLVKANKQAVKAENEQIENFIKRYNWQMVETGSGLRYNIYFSGTGEKAQAGKIAVLKYSTRLITGDIVYSSDIDGLKEFMIGRGGVESGLEEGILLLRVGDRAKFIIPSHLGFGLLGDQDKVPPKSTLIYDIELVSLN
ncbi:MAG: peptidylprolyl isomerase [Bacteroidetes bacterium HGW-Bacteroidetes-11]|jgi:FKBP-type peptidyl-prolyl cis-trans isomerase|nr:MAG: peptidylprolyl isomerase [Bacteroidetes bacterium HGW-Bacteroidetes-11]